MKNSKLNKKKRRFAFTLKSVFIIGTVAAVALTIFAERVERQKTLVKWVVSQGGNVVYSDQFDAKGNYIGMAQPNGFTWIFGRDAIASVKEIWIENQELENLDPLRGISSLEALYLNSTSLKSYKVLTSLRSLKSLSVSNVSEPNISILAEMVWLEHLSLENCNSEFETLNSLTSLRILEVKRCGTIDLNQIVELNHLKRLDLTMVKVKSLAPLTRMKQLKTVNLLDLVIVEKGDDIADIQKKIPGCNINLITLGAF